MALLSFYALIIFWHGIAGWRRSHSVGDYYVGGRRMSGFAIGMSFFATYLSTNTFIGLAGQSYSYGPWWLLFTVFFVGFSLIAWLLLAERLRRMTDELGAVTVADFIGLRYGSESARYVAAIVIVIASVLYMTAIYKGIGTAIEFFFDIPYTSALLGMLLVTMLYTAVGGFVSVVRTDVVQGIIVIIAAAVMFNGAAEAAGGVAALAELRGREGGEQLFTLGGPVPAPVMFGIFIAGAIKFLVDPRQLSRLFGIAPGRDIRIGMWISTAGFLIAFGLLLPLGLFGRLLLPESGLHDTDRVIPALLASGIYSAPVAGFLLVALIAAAMSSLDSVLLVTATTFCRDLLASAGRSHWSDGRMIGATRAAVIGFAVITAVIAWQPPASIVRLTTWSGSLFAACFFPAMLFGLYSRRGNGRAVVASYVAGVAVLIAWGTSPWAKWLHEIFPAVAASLLAFAAFTLAPARQSIPAPTE
ncbi:MAG: hypothetical protein R3E77_00050 [Steroidobacteraceae bacterium]